MSDLESSYVIAAWLTGIASGSGHCLAMCGGIVGALGTQRRYGPMGTVILAATHVGRTLAYAAAGAVVGFAGVSIVDQLIGAPGLGLMRFAAALLVAAIGLQLMFDVRLLQGLERYGARMWRAIAPTARGLLPPSTPLRGLMVGALWGWLPCGLVYAQLSVAAVSGGPVVGAALMAAFGLGTSLGLTALGIVLNAFKLAGLPRRASGMILMAFALWMVWPLGSTHSKASTPDRTSHPSVHDYRADTHSGDGRDVGHRHAID